MENIQKHVCKYCGNEAHYQFKNGVWCCSKRATCCPTNRELRKQKTTQSWKQLKQRGIKHREDIPQKERTNNIDLGQKGICYYCGQKAEYQLANGRWCCQIKSSKCPAIREKNSSGLKKAYQTGVRDAKEIYQNKSQQSKKNMAWTKGKNKYNCNILKRRGQKLHQRYQRGELTPSQLGRKHTPQQIDKIMKGMTGIQRKFINNPSKDGYKRGYYKGYWCDSGWELAFIVYNLDHNIKFQRNTKGYDYWFENNFHRVYPDFILEDGTIVQIKGWFGQKNQQKIKTLKELFKDKFVLITKKEMQQIYLPYVIQTYGNNFYELYDK